MADSYRSSPAAIGQKLKLGWIFHPVAPFVEDRMGATGRKTAWLRRVWLCTG